MHFPGKRRAPEFPKGLAWIGGKPLTMKALRGKVVLLDFWTSSCINCERTVPELLRLHERYRRRGLVVIGVHAPEFAFEKQREVVLAAAKKLGITYPVVLDNAYAIWNLYANRARPRKFVIGTDGLILFDQVGEGGYEETERAVQEALAARGKSKLPDVTPHGEGRMEACLRATPDVYLGYLRGSHGNPGDVLPDVEEAFTDKDEHQDDVPYFHGHWKITKEYAEHSRALPTASEYVALRYSAHAVHAVLGSKEKATFEVQLDGAPIPESMRGADLVERKGRTVVDVDVPRLYRLISADAYHRGTLKLLTADEGARLYLVSFGACKE